MLTVISILVSTGILQLNFTLKAPITTAADDKFCDIFFNYQKKIRYDISWEILMKYRALFVIFEKAAKFETVVCYKL